MGKCMRGMLSCFLTVCMLLMLLPTGVLAAETEDTVTINSEVVVYSVDATAEEYGADPTGTNDSTTAIQNAINAVQEKGGIVYLPAGRYRVEGTLSIYSGITLRGEWQHPDEGGLGQGTILMAYKGAGTTDPTTDPFITVQSGSCLKNIGVWYPEQSATSPVAYPATILGHGHSDVINVTLYNSYYGYYNNDCSSMLIRGLYGTALYTGIHAAYAYDIPRIENTYFDTAYWANSGLDNAPAGEDLTALNTYTEANLIAIQAGEQDWGYWYDLHINHAKYGIFLTAVLDNGGTKMVPGNIAAGEVCIRNAQYGIYAENIGYPGFQLTYGEIEASEYGFYIPEKPDYVTDNDGTLNISYQENASIAISAVTFTGGKGGVYGAKTGNYGISLNDCVFEDWSEYAVRMDDGSLVCSNSRFAQSSLPVTLNDDVAEAIFLGNTFAYTGTDWSDDSRVTRDDANTSVPHTSDFTYTYDFNAAPASQTVFNVLDYGAVSGSTGSVPDTDSTAAFQKALDAAEAAGGGTVFVPGGVYRIEGSLSVAAGVELRGTFESAHYGNSTTLGSQLYVYGGKGEENGTPLITLAENAGVKGFSIFYPEQGYTDADPEHLVYAYPPTIRANANTWIQNMSIVCTYTAIDAITNQCDNIVITDVTGAAMYATLMMGHGTNGGHVQNLHFNYSGWTHQGAYANKPNGDEASALFNDYTTSKVNGLILGDCQNVQFLSCFNILVADQIVLQQDPYTEGSFDGTMWGVAFDAAGNGIVGEAGCDAHLDIIASMGVFNQQGGGYNVVTEPGFTGKVGLYNADAWGSNSQLAYVEGGTVELAQYFSWCAYNGYCGEDGTLNLYGSTLVDNNSNDNGYIPHLVYAEGATGEVVGNLSCREQLNVNVWPGADVTMVGNGTAATVPAATGLVFTDAVGTYTADNTSSTDDILDTGWVTFDNGSTTSGINLKDRDGSLVLQLTMTLTKTDTTAADTVVFGSGRISLRSVDADDGTETSAYWSVADLDLTGGKNALRLCLADMTDTSLNWEKVNRLRVYLDGMSGVAGTYTLAISEAQVVDTTAVHQQKYVLKQLLDEEFNWDSDGYTDEQKEQYTALYNRAQALYADDTATAESVLAVTQELKEMQSVLVSAADKEALRQAVRVETQYPPTLALYTQATADVYSEALDAAHTLLADDEAVQTDINNALSALQAAKAALQVIDRHTVLTISQNWDMTNGTVGENAKQFYHNWRTIDGDPVDLTVYDTDSLVLRMNLRIGLTDDATVSTVPSTLTVKDLRLALRSNSAQPEETSLYDTSILNGLQWGDNLVEIPFSMVTAQDSGNTDWTHIDQFFLSYSITELESAVVGDYIAEIDNVCLVNKAVETTLGEVSVVGNGRIDITGDFVYGGDDVLTADTSDEDSVFVGWRANTAFVRPAEDGSNALSLVATENETVTAYFLKENEKAVVFYGKYNRIIHIQVVTDASELKAPTVPDLEGYTFNGWNEPQENWEWQLDQYDDVMPLYAVYTVDPAAVRYDLTVVGAHRTNGSATTGLLFDECVKVQADTPTGMQLSHWELDGMNVGGGNTYTFYVSGNNVIKAVYVNEGEAVSTPELSAAVKQTIIESSSSGRYTISYICQTYMPSDYTLLEYGAVIAPKMATLTAIQKGTAVDLGLVEGSDYLWVVSSSRIPNRQYMVDLRNVKEGKHRYAMAYVIARDAQGEIHTVYSAIRLASTDTSTDGIGVGDSAVDPFG